MTFPHRNIHHGRRVGEFLTTRELAADEKVFLIAGGSAAAGFASRRSGSI
jgi:hypothetical protein